MDLFIIRHGIAIDRHEVSKDSDRYLTEEGKDKMRIVGKGLKKLGVNFDYILSSPYIRAVQTSEIIAEETGFNKNDIIKTEHLQPSGNWRKIFNTVKKGKYVAIFGHDPMFSDIVAELLEANGISTPVKKGSVCRIFLENIDTLTGELKWFIPPKVFVELLS